MRPHTPEIEEVIQIETARNIHLAIWGDMSDWISWGKEEKLSDMRSSSSKETQ